MKPQLLIIGPRDKIPEGYTVYNTTSNSNDFCHTFSPFLLGPIRLWNSTLSSNMENAWQYSKVYPQHYDPTTNQPNKSWYEWAQAGWTQKRANRYPMGKGTKPLFSWWENQKLDYVEARRRIYLPLYEQAVYVHAWPEFIQLRHICNKQQVCLFDYDGYNHIALSMSMEDVIKCTTRKMGHAFVLLILLTDRYTDKYQIEATK